MTSSTFSAYLRDMKVQANSSRLLVLGNQGADLDSIASALVLAWHLAGQQPEEKPVALIAIPRSDLNLRPDVKFVLNLAGIEPNHLLFTDDMNLDALLGQGTKLVLVDHNRLETGLAGRNPLVSAIIDHHHDEGWFPEATPRIIEPVGSTATLVAELILREKTAVDKNAALLLLSALLLDTVNLSPTAGRCTERDKQVATRLLAICDQERDPFYYQLNKARHDYTHLSSQELLERDYKQWSFPAGSYGISTVLLSLDKLQARESELASVTAQFSLLKNIHLFIVMLASQEGEFKRDLILFCRDTGIHGRIEKFLDKEGLGLSAVGRGKVVSGGLVKMYNQAEVSLSRKKLQPRVQIFLNDLIAWENRDNIQAV